MPIILKLPKRLLKEFLRELQLFQLWRKAQMNAVTALFFNLLTNGFYSLVEAYFSNPLPFLTDGAGGRPFYRPFANYQ
jgi:hypothetical protein